MSKRLDPQQVAPDMYRAYLALEVQVRRSGLEPSLLHLVKLRASYINGCAFCVDMHSKEARADGETEQRVYAVPVWAETPFYSDRERAALAWTEVVTEVAQSGVPDAAYDEVKRHFTDAELVNLTMAIVTINGWNRLAISFRSEPGSYQVPAKTSHVAAR